MDFDRYVHNGFLLLDNVTPIDINGLVSFLENRTDITKLSLKKARIGDEGAKALANLTNLTSLDLEDNRSAVPQNTKSSKLPIIAASLAATGVATGIAIAVYLEMLAVGIAVGACCLVAAAIIYCCRPKSSIENNKVEKSFGVEKEENAEIT